MMRFLHSRAFLILAAFLGCFWLISLSAAVLRNAQSAVKVRHTSPAGILSRTLFMPRSLVEFAKNHPTIESYERLSSLLERAGLKGTWYATRSVEELSDGKVWENVYVTRAGQMTHQFPVTQTDFLTLAGKPPVVSSFDFAKSKVVLLSDEIASRDPSEVLGDLIEREKASPGNTD